MGLDWMDGIRLDEWDGIGWKGSGWVDGIGLGGWNQIGRPVRWLNCGSFGSVQ